MRIIKQFVVRLSDEDHKALKQLALENDTSIQAIITTLVKQHLAVNGKFEYKFDMTPEMEQSFKALMETTSDLLYRLKKMPVANAEDKDQTNEKE